MTNYQHGYAPWLAIAVLIIGIGSIFAGRRGTDRDDARARAPAGVNAVATPGPQGTRLLLSEFRGRPRPADGGARGPGHLGADDDTGADRHRPAAA
ncbi:MAG: hypothetical protein R2867_17085 [Caldilineaceae bacterium]